MADVQTELNPGYLLKRVQHALRRRCDIALRPTGVSMAQYAVLRALADHPNASAAELARLCFVTRQSLQDLLSGLRAASLVDDAGGARTGRARALRVTAEGQRRLDAADDAVMQVNSMMLHSLSRSAQADLADLLLHCANNLESASTPG